MTYTIAKDGSQVILTLGEPLVPNRVYEVTVGAGVSGNYGVDTYTLQQDYTFWFTSTYCPLFSTLTKVKLMAGPSADMFTDDSIYRLIHKNSIDAVDLLNVYADTTFRYDEWGCTWHNVPVILRRYVECKTAYDLLALIDLAMTANGVGAGGQTKTLGDMTISYNGNKSAGDPGKKKELYDCWTDALSLIKSPNIVSAVRGWFDTSKGFPHPSMDPSHNRVIRTVDVINSQPGGPWERAREWRPNVGHRNHVYRRGF